MLPVPLHKVELGRLRRPAMQVTGWLVIGLGVLALPLPGPVATPLIATGGLIILRHSVSARRHYVRMRGRAPGVVRPLFGRFDAWRHRNRGARATALPHTVH